MSYISKMHTKFLEDIAASSKLDSNPYSSLPSVLFLFCSFLVLYFQFHQYTTSFTRWKARIYKDVVFHWLYFYLTRVWFMFLKFGRYITTVLDEYVEANSPKDEISINKTLTHACVFMMVLTVSMMPMLMLSIQQIYRTNIPNFLMWVAEDPWVRSEIGTSGHYLERPARVIPPYKNNMTAYRSKRSTSFDTDIFVNKGTETIRSCKSMMTVSEGNM